MRPRALGEMAATVPKRLGHLVGRARELEELRGLVLSGEPLLTVTGLSGVGKTRLVQEAVGDLIDCWFDAGGRDDAASLIPEIEQWAESRLSAPTGGLHRVVLDSFDRSEGGAALISVLDRFPAVQVICTSRDRLNLLGEVLYRVHPLAYPQDAAEFDVADSARWPAVECFLQTARRVRPDFEVDPGNYATLVELLRLAGGLPLAIELAAQWLRVCDLDELVERASTTMEPFTGGATDLPTHQQDLRVSIQSIVDALPDQDAEVLRALAHLGPVSLEGLGEGLGKRVPLAVLGRLVDRSIIESGAERGRPVTLHPMIRQVVAAGGDGGETQRRFLAWLAGELNVAARSICTSGSVAAAARVSQLAPDVNAGLALLRAQPETVAAIICDLSEVWGFGRRFRSQAYWTTRALEVVGDGSPSAARLHRGACRGTMAHSSGAALYHATRAIELAEDTGDLEIFTLGLSSAMHIRLLTGDWALDERFDRAVLRCRQEGLWSPLSVLLTSQATVLWGRGEVEPARAAIAHAVDAARSSDDLLGLGLALLVRCDIEAKFGDLDAALSFTEVALTLAAEMDPQCCLGADAHGSRCMVRIEQGRFQEAVEEGRLAIAGFQAEMQALELANVATHVAYSLACLGDWRGARAEFIRSLEIWRAMQQPFLNSVALATIAVSPAPIEPPLHLRARILHALDRLAPDFSGTQIGYWGEQLARLTRDVATLEQGTVEEPSLEELTDQVLAHLRVETSAPLPMGLTPREADVLMMVALGATDREIADEMYLSVRTVNSHVGAILRKLAMSNRRQAAAWYRSHLEGGAK